MGGTPIGGTGKSARRAEVRRIPRKNSYNGVRAPEERLIAGIRRLNQYVDKIRQMLFKRCVNYCGTLCTLTLITAESRMQQSSVFPPFLSLRIYVYSRYRYV